MGSPPKHTVHLYSSLSLCWAGRLGDPAVPASFSSADSVGKAMRERDTVSLKGGGGNAAATEEHGDQVLEMREEVA